MTIEELNQVTTKGFSEQLIAHEEQRHDRAYRVVAGKISGRGAQIVLISGPSSSGKTTSSMRIGAELEKIGIPSLHISLDNYFVARELTPKDENGNYDFESINAINIDKLNQDITNLLDGNCVYLQKFDFKEGKPSLNERCVNIKDGTVLIIEGLHALNPLLTSHIGSHQKYKIYLSALSPLQLSPMSEIRPRDNILLRRMIRDYQYRGRSAAQTLEGWADVRRGEQLHIIPFEDESDLILDTALAYEIAVLKPYVMPLLSQACDLAVAERLICTLSFVNEMSDQTVPCNSVLREYIGGSCFEY